ncbi:MAG: aminodeoxychorismate/anthranilate synthase component II [Polyangiaceae bacterium]
MRPDVVLIDNVDSFTHNIAHALVEGGARCRILPHDALAPDRIWELGWEGLVIGPGPCTPREAGVTLALVERLLDAPVPRPALGICLGHQALAMAGGARLRRARRAVHGAVVAMRHDGRGCLGDLPDPCDVARYNSLVVDEASLPDSLVACGWDEDGEVMALRHRDRPLEGIQFHPESWLTRRARPLFRRWVRSLRPNADAATSDMACTGSSGRAG